MVRAQSSEKWTGPKETARFLGDSLLVLHTDKTVEIVAAHVSLDVWS